MASQTPLFATDLTDAEWALLESLWPLLPPDAPTGRPRAHPLRTILYERLCATSEA